MTVNENLEVIYTPCNDSKDLATFGTRFGILEGKWGSDASKCNPKVENQGMLDLAEIFMAQRAPSSLSVPFF